MCSGPAYFQLMSVASWECVDSVYIRTGRARRADSGCPQPQSWPATALLPRLRTKYVRSGN